MYTHHDFDLPYPDQSQRSQIQSCCSITCAGARAIDQLTAGTCEHPLASACSSINARPRSVGHRRRCRRWWSVVVAAGAPMSRARLDVDGRWCPPSYRRMAFGGSRRRLVASEDERVRATVGL